MRDFFDEILINLNLARKNFQTSGDSKSYLTEIKNITGNILSDKEILEFGKLRENELMKKFKVCIQKRKIQELNF